MSATLPSQVIAFVHETTLGDVPDHALVFAKRCVLDLVGVAAAGRLTELSTIIHEHAVRHFGAGALAAPLLFDGRVASPAGAALAGGMTIDAIDAHDGHNLTKGHTGAHQLPSLLALMSAEKNDSPQSMLASLIVGYEFATRAGIALHATASDYHTSGAWGAVGAAALGARVLGLDEHRTFEAMGIAEYHGPRSQMMRVIDHPTMVKDGSGWGAMAGVSAAYLAADGFTGAPAVTVSDPAAAEIWEDLGSHWIIADQYFKPLPVCRWAQPAVEAALALCRDHQIDGEDVVGIEVHTFHEAARLATARPTTTEHAQYSLPFPVAAAVMRGRLTATEITGAGLSDPAVLALAQRVSIVENDAHNHAFPTRRFAQVRIDLADGTSHTSNDTEPRGDASSHLDTVEIRDKFFELAVPSIGDERARSIEAAVADLDHATSLVPLLDLLYAKTN